MKKTARKNIRGGKNRVTYWKIEAIVHRAMSNRSSPKWGERIKYMEEEEKGWTCQCCGALQADGIPSYLMPLDDTLMEYFKICSVCKHIQLIHRIDYVQALINLIRE